MFPKGHKDISYLATARTICRECTEYGQDSPAANYSKNNAAEASKQPGQPSPDHGPQTKNTEYHTHHTSYDPQEFQHDHHGHRIGPIFGRMVR